MSQVLKEMPTWAEDVDALGRPAKYPWRDWLDGETHLLIRTTDEYEGDYQTESRFFRHTVIRAAEKRNIDVFVAVHSGRNYEDKRDRMIIKANWTAPAGLDAEGFVGGFPEPSGLPEVGPLDLARYV